MSPNLLEELRVSDNIQQIQRLSKPDKKVQDWAHDADEASGINGFGFSFADGYHG